MILENVLSLFHLTQLLAPDIRHERNVLLQCVRYVVRNNFFGLEGTSQKHEEMKNVAGVTRECKGRQELQPQPKEDRVHPWDSTVVGYKRNGPEDFKAKEGVRTEPACPDQVFQSVEVHCEPSKLVEDSAAKAEQSEENAAEEGPSLDLTSTDKTTSTSNIYDDEIWEVPGAVMWNIRQPKKVIKVSFFFFDVVVAPKY